MAKCCGGATCACALAGGPGVDITGAGTSQSPFLITAEKSLVGDDTTSFDVTVSGNGDPLTPWHLSVDYASTAKLDHLPDVNAPSPSNGQVLGWDTATSRWTPRAPTTAASGSVTHDTSLSGDGSVGGPLAVRVGAGLQSVAAGVTLTDGTFQSLVRRYANFSERSTASPAPVVNSLSALTTNPGRIDYWTGTEWLPIEDEYDTRYLSAALLEMSGAYDGLSRLTRIVKTVVFTTDTQGQFDVLTTADLTGVAGVLSVQFTEIGEDFSTPIGWAGVMYPVVDQVIGTAFDLTSGAALAGASLRGVVEAWTY